MLVGCVLLMTLRRVKTQPAPPDDVDEIMQCRPSWKDPAGHADVVVEEGEHNLLGINENDLLAQVFTTQGSDVDYLTGHVDNSEPASSSHEKPKPPQLPFHGPNSPEEDDKEELIPDQPDPAPQTLYLRGSGKTVAQLIHETDWERLLQEEGGAPAGEEQAEGEDEPEHPQERNRGNENLKHRRTTLRGTPSGSCRGGGA